MCVLLTWFWGMCNVLIFALCSVQLPQQQNSFDCGLFLLHYVERFLKDAPLSFSPFKISKFSSFVSGSYLSPISVASHFALCHGFYASLWAVQVTGLGIEWKYVSKLQMHLKNVFWIFMLTRCYRAIRHKTHALVGTVRSWFWPAVLLSFQKSERAFLHLSETLSRKCFCSLPFLFLWRGEKSDFCCSIWFDLWRPNQTEP